MPDDLKRTIPDAIRDAVGGARRPAACRQAAGRRPTHASGPPPAGLDVRIRLRLTADDLRMLARAVAGILAGLVAVAQVFAG